MRSSAGESGLPQDSEAEPSLLLASLAGFGEIWVSLLKVWAPQGILEIGSESGLLTRLLLSWCEANKCPLTVIDPAPQPAEQDWMHHALVSFHCAPSLDILPALESCQLVFIDGDHNAYTLQRELDCLFRDGTRPPSCIVIHDTGWPWGERDLYYAPERIPEACRHPSVSHQGPVPGGSELLEWGFCDPGRFEVATVTVSENSPSGLRCVLDQAFSKGPLQDWKRCESPLIFGLTICFDPATLPGGAVSLLETWGQANQVLEPLLRRMERNRCNLFLHYLRNYKLAAYREWELGCQRVANDTLQGKLNAVEEERRTLMEERDQIKTLLLSAGEQISFFDASRKRNALFWKPWEGDSLSSQSAANQPPPGKVRRISRSKIKRLKKPLSFQLLDFRLFLRPAAEVDHMVSFWDGIWDRLLWTDWISEKEKQELNVWRHRWSSLALGCLARHSPVPLGQCLELFLEGLDQTDSLKMNLESQVSHWVGSWLAESMVSLLRPDEVSEPRRMLLLPSWWPELLFQPLRSFFPGLEPVFLQSSTRSLGEVRLPGGSCLRVFDTAGMTELNSGRNVCLIG